MDHEFQSSLGMFDRVQEDGHLPPRVDATNIITHANIQFQWIVTGMKQLSILFKLDYWKV